MASQSYPVSSDTESLQSFHASQINFKLNSISNNLANSRESLNVLFSIQNSYRFALKKPFNWINDEKRAAPFS